MTESLRVRRKMVLSKGLGIGVKMAETNRIHPEV